jgi:hypothetical protein
VADPDQNYDYSALIVSRFLPSTSIVGGAAFAAPTF